MDATPRRLLDLAAVEPLAMDVVGVKVFRREGALAREPEAVARDVVGLPPDEPLEEPQQPRPVVLEGDVHHLPEGPPRGVDGD